MSLSIAERLKKRKEAIEAGDPTGGSAIPRDAESERNAAEIRNALGVRERQKRRRGTRSTNPKTGKLRINY